MSLRKSQIPLYSQIRQVIEQELADEELVPGQRLPSEEELADRFGVSRMTVRHALHQLAAEGVLTRVQGLGTFVTEQPADVKPAGITRWSFERIEQAQDIKQRVLEVYECAPNLVTANALHTMPGELVVKLSRVLYLDGEPLAYRLDRISKLLVPAVDDWALGDDTLPTFLTRHCGLEFGTVEERVRPVLAEPDVAQHLGVEPDSPMLQVHSLLFVSSGVPAILSDTIYRSDRYVYRLNLHPLIESRQA